MNHLFGLLFFLGFASVSGLLLKHLSKKTQQDGTGLVETVNQLLPQTQCGQCNYPGCRPYAQAIIENDEAINRCPPGGTETIAALAACLGKEAIPLADELKATKPPSVAVIREAACIGCVKCIKACPVDAIIGKAKRMHSVLPSLCTGCELCIEPCPVDCIDLIPIPDSLDNWQSEFPL